MPQNKGAKYHDSGHWFTLASALVSSFGKIRTYCDVGCGGGFLVKHLKNLGVEVKGFKLGIFQKKFIKKTSILGLPTDKQWDIVCCWNELPKLYEDKIPQAFKVLRHITKYILVASFATVLKEPGVSNAHTVRSLNWWKDRLEEAGFKIDETLTRRWMIEYKWDSIFVCMKQEKNNPLTKSGETSYNT